MKHLIRVFLFHVFALWIVKELYSGLVIQNGVGMVLLAGLVLGFLMLIAKPMLKILFIPINFLTFGLAGLFINVVVLFLLTIIMPEVIISAAAFPSLSYGGFVVPSVNVNYVGSLVLVSFFITAITHILHAVSED